MIQTKVACIGAGPVGTLASLLLQHYNIDFHTFQKHPSFRSHPSAHWISARSKQILSQIPNLNQQLDRNQQKWDYFTHYRYVQKIGGFQFASKNHFLPSVEQRLNYSKRHCGGQIPNHIPQNKFLNIMSSYIKNKQKIHFNQEIKQIINNPNKKQSKLLVNHKKQVIAQAQYVIICNGVNSKLRDNLNIPIIKKNVLMNIHNIYFKSKKLANLITTYKVNAMLHFVYNEILPGVLVNHSIQEGVFVAQIPNFQPFVNLLQFYTPIQLVKMLLSEEFLQKQNQGLQDSDIQIIHVGNWQAQQLLTLMRKQNVLIAGDSGHSIPPSGGFGMNCGFQDIHKLVHSLRQINVIQKAKGQRLKQKSKQNILNNYSNNRVRINNLYLKQAMQNFRVVDQISSQLGLPQKILEMYQPIKGALGSFLNIFPKSLAMKGQDIRKSFMKMRYNRKKIKSANLQLFFDDFQNRENKTSNYSRQIMRYLRENGNSSNKLYWYNDLQNNSVDKQQIIRVIQGHSGIKEISIQNISYLSQIKRINQKQQKSKLNIQKNQKQQYTQVIISSDCSVYKYN